MTTRSHQPSPTRELRRFLVEAAKLLHRHGTPAHRIEDTLVACAAARGEHLQVFATPTSIEMAFGERRQRPYLIRSDAGEAELARLVGLDAVIARVAAGELEPRAGRRAGPPPDAARSRRARPTRGSVGARLLPRGGAAPACAAPVA